MRRKTGIPNVRIVRGAGLTETTSQNAAVFRPESDDVFARIAGRYDRLCDIFSLGIHRVWKAHMARRAAAEDGAVVLDVASGTGDIPLRLLRRGSKATTIWVTDLCPQMLEMARAKRRIWSRLPTDRSICSRCRSG
jgi:ubiquinone/menaquinone biosynthesis C-methylase UbiE